MKKINHYKKGESILTPHIAKGELYIACFNTSFDEAKPTDTKMQIIDRAGILHKQLTDKGDNYCKLLISTMVREGLKASLFTTKEIRTFREIIRDFDKWWKKNPKLHNAKVLAEYL